MDKLTDEFNFLFWSDGKLRWFLDRLYTSQMERELQKMAQKELDARLKLREKEDT